MSRDWVGILREIANGVDSAVSPLLGTEISRKEVGIGAGGDMTRQIDVVAEEAIIEYLEQNHISCILVGEECGTIKIGKEPEAYMITDAIDGTTNAIRGIDFASTSMAVSPTDSLNNVQTAIVKRLGDREVYTAERGKGAEYDGKKAIPSKLESLHDAVISIDITRSPENIERILPLMKTASHIRSLGSAALEICHVASGQLDAYVDVRGKLRTTDIAAATLILKEAGGMIREPNGDELRDAPLTAVNRFSPIAVANTELLYQILQKLESN